MKDMDYKYIEQLLERYWKCETSLEEEHILRTFFRQKDVPESLRQYRDLFCYEHEEKEIDVLGSDFDAKMLAMVDEPEPVKAVTISLRQRFMPLLKAAASVAIVLALGNVAQVMFNEGGQPEPAVAGFQKTHNGPSVAMSDSAKTDSMKQASAATTILK